MKLDKLAEQFQADIPGQRLNRTAGRKFVYKGPSTTRVTRQQKVALYKEKDPASIKGVLENAFDMMIAAVNGTHIQQFAISKINTLRTQLYNKIENEQHMEQHMKEQG
jgi:hypothetical protein